MRVCCHNNCDTTFDDHGEGKAARCPVCGHAISCWVPSHDDIAAGCELARAEWTAKELLYHSGANRNPHADTMEISQHQRGRRVRRDVGRD